MRVLVTGSSGHLGEGLVRTLRARGEEVRGVDLLPSPFTDHVGSVSDPSFLRACVRGADVVLHTATLHKPHLMTHSAMAFVETNVQGTLNVLESALECGTTAVVVTSTTSVFGSAMRPAEGDPAVWVTEELAPVPRNMYGVTKHAAEHLCELFYRQKGLPSVVLRTSRFFPEVDDRPGVRRSYDDLNAKANEYVYRRVDLADVVEAHLLAAERAPELGFGRYIVSATSPFVPSDVARLRSDAASTLLEYFPDLEDQYARRGWRMFPGIDRVYANDRARAELDWEPRFNFREILDRLARDEDIFSSLSRDVGSKGYHDRTFGEDPYPVESHA